MHRIILLVVLTSANAYGQVQAIPPGADDIRELKLKEPAPIAGMLYSPETALRWANYLEQFKKLLPLSVQKERDLCQASLTLQDKTNQAARTADATKLKTTISLLQDVEKKNTELSSSLNNPAFWDTRDFGLVAGVLGTLVLVLLGGFLIK